MASMFAGPAEEPCEISQTYAYRPLPDERSIRFLHLQPTDDPECRLQAILCHSHLEPNSSYEALSYTWGEPDFTHELYLPEGSLKITQNLHSALRAFRGVESPRVLWIDAICINQGDAVEKGRQVALMGEIYKTATNVLVWLGTGTSETSMAIRFMSSLAGNSEHFGIKNDGDQPRLFISLPQLTCGKPETERLLGDAITAHVHILFQLPWFARLWIVQESSLAKQLQIHCGPDKISWAAFCTATETLYGAINTNGRCPTELREIDHAWSLVRSRAEYRMLHSPGFFYLESKAKFNILLKEMRDRLCKDDRDRVYALLAFAEDVPGIKPDYTKTVAQVYTDVAISFLGYSTLFMAGLCRRGPVSSDVKPQLDLGYLPSWVPDLRVGPEHHWSPMFGNSFATSAAHLGQIGWTRAKGTETFPSVLTARGLQFDSIESIEAIGVNDLRPTKNTNSFVSMVNHIKNMRESFLRFISYPNGQFSELAWAFTLAGGVPASANDTEHPLHVLVGRNQDVENSLLSMWLHYFQFCIDESGEVHQKVIAKAGDLQDDFHQSLSEEGQRAWMFHRLYWSVLASHELFFTKNKYFGLAPPGTKCGDIVAVIGGYRTPFVIRQLQGVSRTSKDCCVLPHPRLEDELVPYCVLLGPCYLHGIMHGEIYGHRYVDAFEWESISAHPSGGTVRLPAQVIHFL